MGNCKDCKYWYSGKWNKNGWGSVSCQIKKRQKPKFYVEDAEGYLAWLMTKSSFGCVLFQKE